MTTYRRFTCVERSITWFLSQDYMDGETELIIYNTDVSYPVSLDYAAFSKEDLGKIKVINNSIDFETRHPYTNVGAIRRDAQRFANGEFYITWDDDDIFFPWNIRQACDGLRGTGKQAWKPRQSFMKQYSYAPILYFNWLEASVLVKMSVIEEYGFKENTGDEHIGWFSALLQKNEIVVEDDEKSIPGYCFYWSDIPSVGGHKHSNNDEFQREDNFLRHQRFTTDIATRAFTKKTLEDYTQLFNPFIPLLNEFSSTRPDLFRRYIEQSLPKLVN